MKPNGIKRMRTAMSRVSRKSHFFPCTIFGQDQIQFKDETQICDENEFIFIRIGLRSKSE